MPTILALMLQLSDPDGPKPALCLAIAHVYVFGGLFGVTRYPRTATHADPPIRCFWWATKEQQPEGITMSSPNGCPAQSLKAIGCKLACELP